MDELNARLIQQYKDLTPIGSELSKEELHGRLMEDLSKLGLPVDFTLDLRGHSKRLYGRYKPSMKKIVVYTLDAKGNQIDYLQLLDTTMHEALHHYQWQHCKEFKRVKGVMHNYHFKQLEKDYKERIGIMYAKA